ncbi:1-(5-phosphoribosyl)-5-[(5-phosphoribosylamino)methylideneamino] imidazole-4-carboxamide isomerase [Tenacibaculum sp. MAR_2009_124]|uniref:1-(5-phosphoribosyl)-5-[(5- phosphoribosylamino)methylideneamino]imidazole-4- carboxamide isomerase n=1 Tax=Tenacibaculum sp. MAR_2009_124 TaxID=1250059 RepID=UPI0008981A29|nr:1-(5-phosphoribosyl)-5-[(5-phosphoribosylamino)methylideneamino]imidazole-4-carboxamide isomerase [Tenacibaculum sp. MAR_2009_124]SEB39865.1 1-(5-phosphoribosyl)-5-[(5-phosphoribosylamino)methylideneamino] imidazole-4-carboxamide isomerase [Tenacibaculum sp. MAR_2009_124]
MKIIPAIDIIEGKCVRLTKGDYNTKKVYNENPLEIAKEFEDSGIQYLHLVDLDGAKSSRIVNHKVLETIASKTRLIIDFGGGLKSEDDARIAFESGASQITGGSIAVKNPSVFMNWMNTYGSEKIILGADCIDRKIATHGWLEKSELDVVNFIKEYESKGVKNCICTDVAKDGMLQGASVDLYKEVIKESQVNLVASGGVSNMDDLFELKEIGCSGAILGKAIYEGKITLKELQQLC